MKNKISKKVVKLIDEFESNVDNVAYNMYSEHSADSAKARIEKDLSYTRLVNYIANLENKLADYKKVTFKGE
jgi:hypothetical protein